MSNPSAAKSGFTLIELLVVVTIVAILVAIAVPNLVQAKERALKSADAANLKVVSAALQAYFVDYNDLPPADREAGPFQSHTVEFVDTGNGPAAGGSWDALPWLLYDLKYVNRWQVLFTNKYMTQYSGGSSVRGGHPRFHNFRYAYNSSALSSGGHVGGSGIMQNKWMVRNLYLPPESGWFGASYPDYPGDYRFPWGEGEWDNKLEHVIFSDFAVRTVIGGGDRAPDGYPETGG